jgi:hypothetical protein
MCDAPPSSPKLRRNPYGRLPGGMRTLRLGLLLALVFGAAGCGLLAPDGRVWVYVDNGGEEPMVVTVDGDDVVTVAPGTFATVKCQPGERRLQVRCGQQVLFDGTKDLQPSDTLGATRRYLFNPENHNRYATYTVKYGSSPIEGLIQSALESPPADRQAEIRRAYRKLAAEVKPLPAASWLEVTGGVFYMLTPPPDSVWTSGYTERRTALTRIDPDDYAFLEAAQQKKDPSEEDLEALDEVVERVQDADR